MKFIKKYIYTLLIITFFVVIPIVSFADTGTNPVIDPNNDGKIHNPLGNTTSIPELIQKALTGALKIGIPVVALAIIYSGFLFVFAMGNSDKLKKAKDALLYTLIGAAVLLGAWAIATLIVTTVQGLG